MNVDEIKEEFENEIEDLNDEIEKPISLENFVDNIIDLVICTKSLRNAATIRAINSQLAECITGPISNPVYQKGKKSLTNFII